MIDTASLSERVQDVAEKLGRLRPDWRDHERYFAERDELQRELRAVARRIEREW